MTDDFVASVERRPVSVSFGLLAGFILGPSIGFTLVLLPGSELVGPSWAGSGEFFPSLIGFGLLGLFGGSFVGIVVAWLCQLLQLWWWGRLAPAQLPFPPDNERGIRPSAGRDETRVMLRTDAVAPAEAAKFPEQEGEP